MGRDSGGCNPRLQSATQLAITHGVFGDFGRSSLPSSTLPTFSRFMFNAAFGPNATIVASRDASVATKSDAIGPPPDPRADGEMVWQPERRCFLILVAKRVTTQTS